MPVAPHRSVAALPPTSSRCHGLNSIEVVSGVAVAIKSLGTRRPSKLLPAAAFAAALGAAAAALPAAQQWHVAALEWQRAFSFLLPHNIRW